MCYRNSLKVKLTCSVPQATDNINTGPYSVGKSAEEYV